MRDASFIPLHPEPARATSSSVAQASPLALPFPTDPDLATVSAPGTLTDTLGRPLRDLRISVTDRCNFRCGYCMPRSSYGPGHRFLPQPALLSFEEIERASRVFVSLGVRKLRLTGGEPLMRKELDGLVARLAPLRSPEGEPVELTLTTNASLLATQAQALKAAGLGRITVSLDALDEAVFQRMNDAGVSVQAVMAGIDAALAAGLRPLKVNMVVQKGVNEGQILPMLEHFRHSGIELRFIEYMDVGATNGWQMQQVMPSSEVRTLIERHHALRALPASAPGETAQRYALADGSGVLGFISSVSQAFCGDCNRLRLSTDGRLYTCLFARQGHDLRAALRAGIPDDQLQMQLRALWQQRADRYSALRGQHVGDPAQAQAGRIEMSYIGG